MMISLRDENISTTTTRSIAAGETTTSTSSITAIVSGGRDTYTYLWQQSGTERTINSSTSSSTSFTGASVAGTTDVYCIITDTETGNTKNTPTCVITWAEVTSITEATWEYNNVPLTTDIDFAYDAFGPVVSVASVTPSNATYTTTYQEAVNAGEQSYIIITGTGNFSGSIRSPIITIV